MTPKKTQNKYLALEAGYQSDVYLQDMTDISLDEAEQLISGKHVESLVNRTTKIVFHRKNIKRKPILHGNYGGIYLYRKEVIELLERGEYSSDFETYPVVITTHNGKNLVSDEYVIFQNKAFFDIVDKDKSVFKMGKSLKTGHILYWGFRKFVPDYSETEKYDIFQAKHIDNELLFFSRPFIRELEKRFKKSGLSNFDIFDPEDPEKADKLNTDFDIGLKNGSLKLLRKS